MKCNPDDYREFFKFDGMTKEQEDKLITELWEISRCFVEMGYGVNPTNTMYASIINTDK